MAEPTETTPAMLADWELEALRDKVAADGGSIEEMRDDDGYHATVTWKDGTVETFTAAV